MPISAGDVWRLYVKPSLDGELVFRKKTTMRRSARVVAINQKVAANPPAKAASQACINAGKSKTVVKYVGGTRQLAQAADIKCFKSQLRSQMRTIVGGGAPVTAPALPA
jgi:hypothetical protein